MKGEKLNVMKKNKILSSLLSVIIIFAMLFANPAVLASDGVYEDGDITDTPNDRPNDEEVSLDVRLDLDAKAAILMEANTGTVLYEENADAALSPASVTKIMTLLLTMEAMDSGAFNLDTLVTASEHAASIGGSQIYLEAGEQMSVEDLIKSVVIASANDAAVVLAEAVCGTPFAEAHFPS